MRIAIVSAVILIAGCTTTLAPGAREIVLTRKSADVEHCMVLGNVQSSGQTSIPGDDLNELRNQATGMGADTVLVTSPALNELNSTSNGVAYECKPPPPEEAKN